MTKSSRLKIKQFKGQDDFFDVEHITIQDLFHNRHVGNVLDVIRSTTTMISTLDLVMWRKLCDRNCMWRSGLSSGYLSSNVIHTLLVLWCVPVSRFDVNKICVVVVKPLKIVWKRVYTVYRDERVHLDRNQWSTSVVGLYLKEGSCDGKDQSEMSWNGWKSSDLGRSRGLIFWNCLTEESWDVD